MAIEPPKLESRGVEELLAYVTSLIPHYTPEWKPEGPDDPGRVLLALFARLYREVLVRRNDFPAALLSEFLRTLGIDRLPAAPAKVPVVFTVNPDCPEPYVPVPAASRLGAGEDEEGDVIHFETTKPLAASPAALARAVSADRERDVVRDHTSSLGTQTGTAAFDPAHNGQTHEIYVGDGELLNFKGESSFAVEFKLSESVDQSLFTTGAPSDDRPIAVRAELGDVPGKVVIGDINAGDRTLTLDISYDGKGQENGVPETELAGTVVKSRWLKVQFQILESYDFEGLARVRCEGASVRIPPAGSTGVVPDMVFRNDVPLDIKPFKTGAEVDSERLRPFGYIPTRNDAFYAACDEAFGKAGAEINLIFSYRDGAAVTSPVVVWEYYNGDGWLKLSLDSGITGTDFDPLLKKATSAIGFHVPADIKKVKVNGHEHYWIRARLADGDYGEVVYSMTNPGTVNVNDAAVIEPAYDKATLSYTLPAKRPAHVYVKDNLATRKLAGGTSLLNLTPTPAQAVYFGFDKPLAGSPASLYLHLKNYLFDETFAPDFKWSVSGASGKWVPTSVADGTRQLTRSGYVSFSPPAGFVRADLFGQKLYWLKAENAGARFEPPQSKPGAGTSGEEEADAKETGLKPCPRRFPTDLLPLPSAALGGLPTLIAAYVNAAESTGTFIVSRELLGSTDGTASQEFLPAHNPVFDEAVWLEESKYLSPEEIPRLRDERYEVEEKSGAAGEAGEVWVRWRRVDTFAGAGPGDRVYGLDATTGAVAFGDGSRGMAPPPGRDNVVMSYRTGGGRRTNVPGGDVAEVVTGVSYVDQVANPLPAAAGEDLEPLEAALKRGPSSVRFRGRALTAVDFEDLIRQRFRGLARVKCFPCTDAAGNPAPGSVTVILVPEGGEARPELPIQLRDEAESYLRERAAALPVSAYRINVVGPVYVQCDVTAAVQPRVLPASSQLLGAVRDALAKFLHPLTGGGEGNGWEFGRVPTLADIYAEIERVEGVETARAASFTIRAAANGQPLGSVSSLAGSVHFPASVLVSSGDHDISLSALPEEGG
jgi:hypothetical protein